MYPPSEAVLENGILPRLCRSRKHSEKYVSSVVIHCRKFFSHFPHIGFGRITNNASLPDRWLQQVNFTFDQAAQPESSAVLSCYGWKSLIQVQPCSIGNQFIITNATFIEVHFSRWFSFKCLIMLSFQMTAHNHGSRCEVDVWFGAPPGAGSFRRLLAPATCGGDKCWCWSGSGKTWCIVYSQVGTFCCSHSKFAAKRS